MQGRSDQKCRQGRGTRGRFQVAAEGPGGGEGVQEALEGMTRRDVEEGAREREREREGLQRSEVQLRDLWVRVR